jgi:protein dithiol:quinone oxidoreductase
MMSSASCAAAPAPRSLSRRRSRSRRRLPPCVPERRLINAAGFAACAALLAYALYAQFHLGLDPCPLCIFQRIGVALLAAVFLAAALHHPRGRGRYGYALVIALAALATAAVAARHMYVQSLPPGSLPSCGAPLSVLLKFMPLGALIRKVLTGSGECITVNWRFLGLAMPAWVLIWALLLGAAGVVGNLRREGSAAR